MSGKTFVCFVYEHARLDEIENAIDALQDAHVLDWVEITLPGDSWISVVKGHDGFPVTERGKLVQTPVTAKSARRYVGRMLYERFKGGDVNAQLMVVFGFVYEGDEFEIDTKTMHVRHVPRLELRAQYIVGAHAYAVDASNNVAAMAFVSRDDLDVAKRESHLPWDQYPMECVKKVTLDKLADVLKGKSC